MELVLISPPASRVISPPFPDDNENDSEEELMESVLILPPASRVISPPFPDDDKDENEKESMESVLMSAVALRIIFPPPNSPPEVFNCPSISISFP